MAKEPQGPEQRPEFEEKCINCGAALLGQQNWRIADMREDNRYCTKQECQAAKPVIMTSTKTWSGKGRKKREPDAGLSQTLEHKPRAVNVPNPAKVQEFKQMLADPKMLNARGIPQYSKIFREYKINESEKGFTGQEMAAAHYPEEVDVNGCPSKRSVSRIRSYLKTLTKRYDGNLELYSTKVKMQDEPYRTESRWHTLKEPEDLNKQVNVLYTLSKNIEKSAKQREVNFASKTYDERMHKVTLLDRFFDENDTG